MTTNWVNITIAKMRSIISAAELYNYLHLTLTRSNGVSSNIKKMLKYTTGDYNVST